MRDLEKPILVLLTLLTIALGISDMNYGEQSDCLVPTSRTSAVNPVNTVQNPTRLTAGGWYRVIRGGR